MWKGRRAAVGTLAPDAKGGKGVIVITAGPSGAAVRAGRGALRLLLVAALVSGLLVGCGYMSKKQEAKRLIDPVDLLERARTASGTISLTLRLNKRIATVVTRPQEAKQPHPTLSGIP